MPFAVAITRLAREQDPGSYRTAPSERAIDPSRWLPPLAARLGVAVYDLRMRLAGEAPWMIANVAASGEADALVSSLRADGFGAVGCDLDARPWVTREGLWLALGDEGVALDPDGLRLPYGSLRLVILATLDAELGDERVETVVVARRQRGMPVTAEVSRFSYARKQQRAAYLFSGLDRPAVRLTQDALRTTGVAGVTSRERFDRVVAGLRARCPAAVFDERLVGTPRRRTSFAQGQAEGQRRGSVSDNAGDTDLAAWALCLAAESGQL